MATLCTEALRRREEKKREEKERDIVKKCAIRSFVTLLLNNNKDKVPMVVATSLVVNHVNLGALYLFMLYLCLWLC